MARTGLAVFALSLLSVVCSAQPVQPNVLIIIADDLNMKVGAYGDPLARTPNIDELANRGVRFDRAYVTYPLCQPSRASILWSMRPADTLVTTNGPWTAAQITRFKALPNLASLFRAAGYYAAASGKVQQEGGNAAALTWDWSNVPLYSVAHDPTVASDIAAKMALPGPWLLVAGFHNPHAPYYTDAAHKLPTGAIPLPTGYPTDDLADLPVANPYALQPLAGRLDLMAQYYSAVWYLDAQVGVLMARMNELALWDHTVVLFVSDNGYHVSEHGLGLRKQTLFQESIHVPLIVAAPGMCPRCVSDSLVEAVDIVPTLLDLSGIQAPLQFAGISFAPLLATPSMPWKAFAYSDYGRGRAVTNDRFTYIGWNWQQLTGAPFGEEFYDHLSDPLEITNRASERSSTLLRMRSGIFDGWRFPFEGPDPCVVP